MPHVKRGARRDATAPGPVREHRRRGAVLSAENDGGCDGDDEDRRRHEQEDDSRAGAFGPGYIDSLMAVGDAVVGPDVLDRVLDLADRWPEPRVLDQTSVFFLRDRTPVPVDGMGSEDARRLLAHVRGLAMVLHEAAARDEEITTSTAMRWAMAQACVPSVAELDPLAWLESTALVRHLAGLVR